jgi:hypothetical protein
MTRDPVGLRGDPPVSRLGRPWNILLPVMFAIGSADFGLAVLLDPRSVGSHAVIYTEAARAWLEGGNPWTVGPPSAVFAGPPTMLLPFVPFVALPGDVTRVIWVAGTAILAVLVLRLLRLPGWWIGFPPIFHAILLGHPEILVLWLIVGGGLVSGLAAVIKPYAGLPLLAERRWLAIAFGLVVVVITVPLLPWQEFIQMLPTISAIYGQQTTSSDSTFGSPVLMIVAVGALALLGWRRGLWLATPLLWPGAQPIYKVVSVPALSPLIALIWALPVPIAAATHATLIAVVIEAAVRQLGSRRPLPLWVREGVHGGPWRDGEVFNQGEQQPNSVRVPGSVPTS